MRTAFDPFGVAHFGAVAAVLFGAAALAFVARRDGFERTRRLRVALAVLAIAAWVIEATGARVQGWWTWEIGLPLELCDVALGLAAAALLTGAPTWIEPLWFVGLAGTLPALLWPDFTDGFPSFRFLAYFLAHGVVVAVGWMLVRGYGRAPRPGSWWRVLVALNLYALAVTPVNLLLGTNFLFLRGKPPTPSPIDDFGPWPWYLLTLEVLAAGLFFALERSVTTGAPAGPVRKEDS